MLVFAQTFVVFLSQGDHFSNVQGFLIFACQVFAVPKRFTIYFHFNIILHFILKFTLFFLQLVLLWICFNRFYSSYQ